MHTVAFDCFLNNNRKYSIIANCKSIDGNDILGLKLTFIDDNDVTVKTKYDPVLFEELRETATELLLEDYYYPKAISKH